MIEPIDMSAEHKKAVKEAKAFGESLCPLHFIAQMINSKRSKEEGYSGCTRWGVLREDLKEAFIKEAGDMYEEWKQSEIEAAHSRANIYK